MTPITISTVVDSSLENTWKCWNNPEDMMEWNHASDDWHCPAATSDFVAGGRFSATMAANDGSVSFDFSGIYTEIEPMKSVKYTLPEADYSDIIDGEKKTPTVPAGRNVSVTFEETSGGIKVTETFDPEEENSLEMQQAGWQAILDNFREYTEANS